MPKKLEDCVRDVTKQQEKEKSQKEARSAAFAICAKSTGWVRGKGGKWIHKPKSQIGHHLNESVIYKIEKLLQSL